MRGKVYLVGAGPGDPGLLTVKASRLIRDADLLIYDYLANPDHLRLAKKEAVKIGLGKGYRYRRLGQQRINRLIVRAARDGKQVVRLKGGDPYLFGRGGEEALALYRNRVPFEVVPGVTSATACAAYAGIPLTHREHNASVTFLTGHRADDARLDSVRWSELVALDGTLVVYMGFYNLGIIAEKLIKAGMSADTKVSVIEWGTLPRQKSCDGTLRDIQALARRKGLKPPSLIVIGDVVSLRKELNWYERLPLFGQRVLITRTRDKSAALKDKLSELGAETIEFPTIEVKPLRHFAKMDETIKRLSEFDWVVFTSTYGVDAFFDRLSEKHRKDARAVGGLRVAAVGPQTAEVLKNRGILADAIPRPFETEAILRYFKTSVSGIYAKKILLVRADIAPENLEKGLEKMGSTVRRLTAYRTEMPKTASAALQKIKSKMLRGEIDWVTFTSASTVRHFVKMVGLGAAKKIARKTRWASIGPVTSKTLRDFGLRPACQARVYTIDGLVRAMQEAR
ncbi:MAG: uroporphyrinogen-III C-methyltransferase [Candidatus Omnitrophica bacterium]|nr:uroporphyrinogen-III C-methyltransferase [Candidatus Omnitrophota bacterium]